MKVTILEYINKNLLWQRDEKYLFMPVTSWDKLIIIENFVRKKRNAVYASLKAIPRTHETVCRRKIKGLQIKSRK